MPTSAPGNSSAANGIGPSPLRQRATRRAGFTLIELMVVIAIVAIAAAVASLALRDPARERLERDAARLAALLEMARTESRATGLPVLWVPEADPAHALSTRFRFVGLNDSTSDDAITADHFLDSGVQVQLVAAGVQAAALSLGPDAVLPPQRVVLQLQDARLEVASDGVRPFSVQAAGF